MNDASRVFNIKTIMVLLCLTVINNKIIADIPIKSQLQTSIKEYEESIFNLYKSIEFTEYKRERIKKNNKLDTEYSQTRYFIYDFEKKVLQINVIDFKLIDGKNTKNIKIGQKKKEKLKDFYGLSSYFNNYWKNVHIDKKTNTVSFNTNQWIYSFNCDIKLQRELNFPSTIQAVTTDEELQINLNYDFCNNIYMLTQSSTHGSYQILFDKFNLDSYTIRKDFKIVKK